MVKNSNKWKDSSDMMCGNGDEELLTHGTGDLVNEDELMTIWKLHVLIKDPNPPGFSSDRFKKNMLALKIAIYTYFKTSQKGYSTKKVLMK